MNHKAIALLMTTVLLSGVVTASSFAAETAKAKWNNGVEHVKEGSERAWHATETETKKLGSHIKSGTQKMGHHLKNETHKVSKHLHHQAQ